MEAFIADWLNLLLRWAHMIVGIGWIGASFYFVALDFGLKKRIGLPAGVFGEAWQVHGGGFYHVQKFLSVPPSLPPALKWFKWEAYLTWASGFLLLVLQYYLNASIFLIDPAVLPLAPWQAIAISVAGLTLGWLSYDLLCRSPLGKRPALLVGLVFVMILAASYGFSQVFGGRAALIHVGAFTGTMMAANVFMVIIPNQRKIVGALLRGDVVDPRLGAIGKQRSLHNTYLTLPVLVLMVSNHYPMITGHPQAWVLVGLIFVGGATLRHFLVRHEAGDPLAKLSWTLPVVAAALFAALWLTAPISMDSRTQVASDDAILALSEKHCVACHAAQPAHQGFAEAPKGVMLETLDQLRLYAPLISAQAVQSEVMPLGNETGMTTEERAQLGAWIAAQ